MKQKRFSFKYRSGRRKKGPKVSRHSGYTFHRKY